MEIQTLLCVGGPIDGETRSIYDGQKRLTVAVLPPLQLDTPNITPDASEISVAEHHYSLLKLDRDIEFLYYEPDGSALAFRKLLTCYAPRLAKLAENEQRRHV